MPTSDDRFVNSSVGTSPTGSPLGLILNQLIIITLILKEAYGILDDDFTLLTVTPPASPPNVNTVQTI